MLAGGVPAQILCAALGKVIVEHAAAAGQAGCTPPGTTLTVEAALV